MFPFLWTICVHPLPKFLLGYWSFRMDFIGVLYMWDKLAFVYDLSCKYYSECRFWLCLFFPMETFLFENNRIYQFFLLSGLFIFSFFFMLREDFPMWRLLKIILWFLLIPLWFCCSHLKVFDHYGIYFGVKCEMLG